MWSGTMRRICLFAPVLGATYIEKENSVALYISTRTASVSERRAMFEFPFQVTTLSRWSPVRTSQSPKLNPLRAGICG